MKICHPKTTWYQSFERSQVIYKMAQNIEKDLTKVAMLYLELEDELTEAFVRTPEIDCHLMDSLLSTSRVWNSFKNHFIKIRLANNDYSKPEADEIPTFSDSVKEGLLWLTKFGPTELKGKSAIHDESHDNCEGDF